MRHLFSLGLNLFKFFFSSLDGVNEIDVSFAKQLVTGVLIS